MSQSPQFSVSGYEIRKSKRKRIPRKLFDVKSPDDEGTNARKSRRRRRIRIKKEIINETRINILVKKTFDKVRKNFASRRSSQISSLWEENLKKLNKNLQDHHRRQTSSSCLSSSLSCKDMLESFKTVTEASSASGPQITVKFYKTIKKVLKDPPPPVLETIQPLPPPAKKQNKPPRDLRCYIRRARPNIIKPIFQDICNKQTSAVITLPELSRIPPVLAWTSIPYNIYEDDGKFLTNIPFLGDEVIDKDKKFIDDMVNLYQGKIHGLPDDEEKSKRLEIEDDLFYDLVEALMELEKSTNGIFKEDPNPDDEADTVVDWDEQDVKDVTLLKEEEFCGTTAEDLPVDVDMSHDPRVVDDGSKYIRDDMASTPSNELYTAISITLEGIGTVDMLKERYENLRLKKLVPEESQKLPILSSGVPQQDPSSYFIPNIEGPYAKDLPKEFQMHAYQFLFCRRCYQYDCPRGHNGDDHVDLKYYKQTRNPLTFNINYVCEDEKCYLKSESSISISRTNEEISAEWTPGDQSMFRCLFDSFPNPCYVAKLMMNKTCEQVKEYANLADNPLGDPDSNNSTLLPLILEKPSCDESGNAIPCTSITSNNNRKKSKPLTKKSSSVSKKNLARRWINNVKRSEKNGNSGCSIGSTVKTGGVLPPRFMPCQHDPSIECDEKNPQCYCGLNGTSCEKFCTCPPSCKRRFPGCRCNSTCDSKRCVCFFAARECDPDLCTGCGAQKHRGQNITCRNVNIQKRLHKHLLKGASIISGWGIFIKEDAQRGDFIAEYRGEIISHDESERRGHVYDKIQHTFLFELNDHFVVDATRKGNKSRFVNSSKNPNCEVKRMLVNGDHRIGIYAKRYIEAGEELYYNYEDVLEKQQKVAIASTAIKSSLTSSPTISFP